MPDVNPPRRFAERAGPVLPGYPFNALVARAVAERRIARSQPAVKELKPFLLRLH